MDNITSRSSGLRPEDEKDGALPPPQEDGKEIIRLHVFACFTYCCLLRKERTHDLIKLHSALVEYWVAEERTGMVTVVSQIYSGVIP